MGDLIYRCSDCLRLRPWCDGASAGEMRGFCDGCTAKKTASLRRKVLSTLMPWWFGFYRYRGCPGTQSRPCLICTKAEEEMKAHQFWKCNACGFTWPYKSGLVTSKCRCGKEVHVRDDLFTKEAPDSTEYLRHKSGGVTSDDNLVSFLYELMRDHVTPGVVEQVMRNSVARINVDYTNGWLAEYAKYIAERLRQDGDSDNVAL